MAPHQPSTYDRVLDWCSDHRMAIAKGFVLFAVGTLLLGVVAAALSTLLAS